MICGDILIFKIDMFRRAHVLGMYKVLSCLLIVTYLSRASCLEADEISCAHGRAISSSTQVTATASLWANIRKSADSVRANSERMLNNGAEALKSKIAVPSCCTIKSGPKILFRSTPAKFLSNYPDQSLCTELERQTELVPLHFAEREYASIEQISNWFNDFSSGKGDDGLDLYKRCPGSCSPRYSLYIEPNPAGFSVGADVICGQARDKDDNQFVLSQSLVWQCQK